MAEYIERTPLIALMREMEKQIALCHIRPQLAGAIAEELEKSEPVVHGQWNAWCGENVWQECSVCHYRVQHSYSRDCNYCPNCGARMDGE